MEIVRTIAGLQTLLAEARSRKTTVGLVPTMGYLHKGHMSLIRRACAENDTVVVSIFVNPTQFGPAEDFSAYPRDLERDAALCREAGADIVFAPEPAEMYPESYQTFVEVGQLSLGLCGDSRPGHFRGVATVVAKLFNIVGTCHAYFGQKDAQQLAVIRRMVRDLNMPVHVVGMPIIRESDGLAMSSRNTYLNPEERLAARVLSQALRTALTLLSGGERHVERLLSAIREHLAGEPLAVPEYVVVVDAMTLEPLDTAKGKVLIALAVRIGRTRLIDNVLWDETAGAVEV